MKKLMLLIALATPAAGATFVQDMSLISHLRLSIPMCLPTTVNQIRECYNIPQICGGQGNACFVWTGLNKFALVCNPVVGQTYEYCSGI